MTNSTTKPDESSEASDKIHIPKKWFDHVLSALVFFVIGMIAGTYISLDDYVEKEVVRDVVRQTLEEAGWYDNQVDMAEMEDTDPYIGAEDAPVTIIEFSAYGCPYCREYHQNTLEPLLEEYGDVIKYVYRDYPVVNREKSESAALAANCALEQGKFWEYHDQLYANQDILDNDYYHELADELNLNMQAFSICVEEKRYANEVENDHVDALTTGMTGTPSFLINGRRVSGAMPFHFFERIIEEELKNAVENQS